MAERVTCADCDTPIDPARAYEQVTGWLRRGSSSLKLRRSSGRYLCHGCMVARETPGSGSTQAALL